MPELHDLPDLVDPSDFELSPAQQRRAWLRNHAFALAFGVTFVLATVMTVRVVTLEARHSAPVSAAELAPAVEAPAEAQVDLVSTSAPVEDPSDPVAEARPLPAETVPDVVPEAGAVLTPRAAPAPFYDASLHASLIQQVAQSQRATSRTQADRQRTTRRSTRSRRTPPRAVDVAAVAPRAVAQAPAKQEEVPADVNSGTLTVQVQPWGSVFINDRLVQREVNARFQTRLQAGTYPVRVVHPVLGTWRGVARVQPGKEVALFVNFNK